MTRILAATGTAIAVVLSLLITSYIGMAMFQAGPTGEYHTVASYSTPGLTVEVYQDMRFKGDRLVFVGPPAQAYQVLQYLQNGGPAEVQYQGRTADLILELPDGQ
jgi:guanyl-specific ribonuclease Sa